MVGRVQLTTLSTTDHVVVVGAGLAGWRTCEELRNLGFEGQLTLIGEEPHVPYDRPPLSKQVMSGKWDLAHTVLATPERLDAARVTMRLGVGASRLDVATATVVLSDGTEVQGTHVVIATGARARRLAWHEDFLYEVRTRDDAHRLISRLAQLSLGDLIAIIGAGFIGAEVATAVAARGLRPLLLEAAALPLVGVVGPEVAQWLSVLPAAAGIELRTNQKIVGTARVSPDARDAPSGTGEPSDAEVLFADGTRLAAGAVVVGVGAQPNTEWLEASGLELENGVVVDANLLCRAHVAAVGDVANFPWSSGQRSRIEHWEVASNHARALARHWMTGEPADRIIPYFWSDQYGKKIQMLGHPRSDDDVLRVRSVSEEQWLAIYSRQGVVTGIIGLGQPRALMLSRSLLEVETTLEEARALAPWAP